MKLWRMYKCGDSRPGCPSSAARTRLLRIPLQQPYLNPRSSQRFLKDREIGPAIVVRDHDLRMESFDRVGRFFGRHGIRQIHTNEGNVNIFERAHFRHALGVAGKVEALSAISENITVTAAFVVEKLPGSGPALQV